jgi:hypothetical protein
MDENSSLVVFPSVSFAIVSVSILEAQGRDNLDTITNCVLHLVLGILLKTLFVSETLNL